MKPTTPLIIIVVVLLLVLGLGALAWAGFIEIPGLFSRTNLNPDDPDAPLGAVFCDYTDIQILDMIELASGKDLNNQIGIGFVRSLSMQACGSDDTTPTEILNEYRQEYFDWHIQYDQTTTGSGWTARTMSWSNTADATNSTLAKMVSSVSGLTVKEMYGYDTITIHSEGTMATYQAFMLWLISS